MEQKIKTDTEDESSDEPYSTHCPSGSATQTNLYNTNNRKSQNLGFDKWVQRIYTETQSPKINTKPCPKEDVRFIQLRQLWQGFITLFAGKKDNYTLRGNIEKQLSQSEQNTDISLSVSERNILRNVIDFGDMRVYDLMVPRADIISVEYESSLETCLRLFRASRHSRILVYKNTLDTPIGMLHIKDILYFITQDSVFEDEEQEALQNDVSGADKILLKKMPQAVDVSFSLSKKQLKKRISQTDLLREVLFVPASMTAANLLLLMQRNHTHMAVVVDEYGGTDGIVTMENLVEEIIGSIVETGQEYEDDIKNISDKECIVSARVPLTVLEKIVQKDLQLDDIDEDVDTLGGLISLMIGRVPTRGEVISHPSGIEFTVLEADPRRIKKLKIENY